MLSKLQPYLDRLDANHHRFLDELTGYSPAQRIFRVTESAWTPLQVAEHVVLAETGAVKMMADPNRHPNQKRSLKDRFMWLAVKVVLTLHFKAKAPKRAEPRGSWDLETTRRNWQGVRDQLAQYLEGLTQEQAQRKVFDHPYAGPLDVEKTLDFMDKHLEHHIKQLERIRSSPDWPT